jgi:hypothetical protein
MNPCGACARHDVDCIFSPSQPRRNRRKSAKEQILTDRVRHYEALLREKGIDPTKLVDFADSEPCRESSNTVAVVFGKSHLKAAIPIEPESSRPVNNAQVIHSQGRSQSVNK